jgi:uncharacterized protein DUF4252
MRSPKLWLFACASVVGLALPSFAADTMDSKDEHPAGWVDGSSLLKLADDEDVKVEVSISGALLKLAASAIEDEGDEGLKELVGGLDSINVLVISLGEHSKSTAAESIKKMGDGLKKKGWSTLARVHEEDANVNVLINSTDTEIRGLVVLVVDENEGELVFVNIVGKIDVGQLEKVAGHLDVPGLEKAFKGMGEAGKHGEGKERHKDRKDREKHDEKENVR